MGIAALVIGVISLIIGFIPACGIVALVPAIVGLILGVVHFSKQGKASQPRGIGIAAIVLNVAAIAIIGIWVGVLAGSAEFTVETSDANSVQTEAPDTNDVNE